MKNFRQAFSMLELVFVIVVIGVLSAIAIPKFATTRNDAIITKGKSTLAAVRSALATERQKRILRGEFSEITSLGASGGNVFTGFDGNTSFPVLEYPPKSGTGNGQWSSSTNGRIYTFHYYNSGTCDFNLTGNRLKGTCDVFGD